MAGLVPAIHAIANPHAEEPRAGAASRSMAALPILRDAMLRIAPQDEDSGKLHPLCAAVAARIVCGLDTAVLAPHEHAGMAELVAVAVAGQLDLVPRVFES